MKVELRIAKPVPDPHAWHAHLQQLQFCIFKLPLHLLLHLLDGPAVGRSEALLLILVLLVLLNSSGDSNVEQCTIKYR